MNKLFTRLMIATLAIVSLTAMVPQSALAATGPWQWSDISDKLTARENRPVWAMAYASPYWYMTDGQDLYSGGHVWKTDGAIVSDITSEVRTAGLSRVDDIVSDGQTIIFLKNVVSGTRNFEALSLKGGTYGYPAYKWQSLMSTDEGISSINGKNGEWMIVTSKARVLSWNAGSNALIQISLPTYSGYGQNQIYSVRHTSPADGYSTFRAPQVVPTSNGWIFAIPQTNASVNVYYYQNGQFNSLSTSLSNIQFIASNGSQVLIKGNQSVNSNYGNYNYDGFVTITGNSVYDFGYNYKIPGIDWSKALAAYNSKSWIITSGKYLYRFTDSGFTGYSAMQDYFVTIKGNGNGTFLLGGAVSSEGRNEPTSPLTAKLVRADENTGYASTPSNTVTASNINWNEKLDTAKGTSNNITYWAWFNPGLKNHENIIDPKYTVGAQSKDGINKIELYINGARQRVCEFGNSKNNVECAMFIESTGYAYGSDVSVDAKITNGKGQVTTVPVRAIRFHDTTVTATMSVGNNTPYLYRGSSNNVTVNGYAGTGIERVEIYVNGQVKQTCYAGSDYRYAACNISLNGNDYNAGGGVAFNGRVISKGGQEAWTWLGYYTVVDGNGTYVPTSQHSSTNWFDFDPSGNDLNYNQSKTIKARAYDTDGLKMMEILVNGQVKQTCYFNRVYTAQSCQVTIYGSNYSGQTNIPVFTRATDYYNNVTNSNTQFLNAGQSYGNNYDTTLSAWFGANVQPGGIQKYTDKTFEFYGQSSRGLRQLDLYANDVVIATCTYNDPANSAQSCTKTINLSNYSDYQTVKFRVKATDKYANSNWSPTVSMRVVPGGSSVNQNSSISLSTTDNKTAYNKDESFTLYAYSTDYDGIQRIDLYANGLLLNSCTPSNPTSYTCSATVRGSNYTSNSMSLPLQAKMTDRYGNTSWSSTKYVQINGIADNYYTVVKINLSPNKLSYTRQETFMVSAEATDGHGIQKMEIYVNNSLWQSCNTGYGTTASCSATVSAANYPSNIYSLPIRIRVTDNTGNVVWSATRGVPITDTASTPVDGQEADIKGDLNISSTGDNGYVGGQQLTFTANGSDSNGIERLELYVNANLVKTCYGATTCSYTGSYTDDSLTYGAKMTDNLGNTIWNGYKTIYKQ